MSNSYKKTPRGGWSHRDSEKHDKRLANRRLRLHVRQALLRGDDTLPLLREVSSVWCMAKDGKCWWGSAYYSLSPYWNARVLERLMRK